MLYLHEQLFLHLRNLSEQQQCRAPGRSAEGEGTSMTKPQNVPVKFSQLSEL